jgi:hypothetical protein
MDLGEIRKYEEQEIVKEKVVEKPKVSRTSVYDLVIINKKISEIEKTDK